MTNGLFPNTGHHFFFLPFSDDPDAEEWQKEKVHPEVLKACDSDIDNWGNYQDPSTNTKLPWLLWRLGLRRCGAAIELGVHVCIDTNIGDCSRGNLLRREVESIPHKPYNSAEFSSAYFAESLNSERLRDETPNKEQIIHQYSFTNEMLLERVPNYTPAPPEKKQPNPPPIPSLASPGLALQSIAGMGALGAKSAVKVELGAEVQCFEFWWPRVMANPDNVWDVDLIVDFGNSRSVALLLERPPIAVGANMPTLGNLLSPVRMIARGESYQPNRTAEGAVAKHSKDPLALFDSWFVTREPQFAHLHPPHRHESEAVKDPQVTALEKKIGMFGFSKEVVQTVTGIARRVPHLFMEMSPCALGKDANNLLAKLKPERGGTMFLSSPKRYAWDTDPLAGMEWCMVPNRGFTSDASPRLCAHALAYMPEHPVPDRATADSDWAMDDPPPLWPPDLIPSMTPDHPHYPRADSMTWVALAIIEQAYRQMCSEEFRRTNERFMIRRLRSVVVTYPPGWTGDELRVYRKKWNTAINVFAHCHLADPEAERPQLDMGYDEAISAQLPIVYSEIRRMGNDGDSWLRLMGREVLGQMPKARVMTIDVGGGTTDYSVYEYDDRLPGAGVDLDCSLMFKDSSNIAGDQLVEALITEMLLPKIAQIRAISSDPVLKPKFEMLFNPPGRSRDDEDQWRKIVRLVLVPQINHWLTSYSNSGGIGEPNFKIASEVIVAEALELLNTEWEKVVGKGRFLLEFSDVIAFSYREIEDRIRRIFRPLCDLLARLVEAYDVDMVILSGKPSELPGLRSLVTQLLPLLPCRIVSVKDYPIEPWYPYQENGRIYDAKTVTATGVALSRAMSVSQQLTPDWAPVTIHPSENLLRENCWVRVPNPGEPMLANGVYLDNGTFGERQEESKWCALLVGARIGRTLLPTLSNVEPVYRLRWRSKEDENRYAGAAVRVRFRRVPPQSHSESESIELVELVDERSRITMDMVELQLCTLQNSSFWMDRATFSVRWPTP